MPVLAVLVPGFHEGVLKTVFVDSWLTLSLFGHPEGGFRLTLLDLIILALIALAANGVTEWLTGRRIASLLVGMVITVLGTFLILSLVRLPAPWDFAIEDIVVIPALIGSILIAVLYVLIRTRPLPRAYRTRRARTARAV